MASYPQVQTTQAGMQSAAQLFSNTATDFTNDLKQVNELMGTLAAGWTGQAFINFKQGLDSWEESFQKIINQLLNMMEVMGVNVSQYQASEDNAISYAKPFLAGLPGF